MPHDTDSEARRSILSRIVTIGLLAVILIAPTQYSFEIRDKTYLSIVDPLLWLVGLLWVIDLAVSRRLRTIKPPPLVTILFVFVALLSITKAENRFSSLKDVFQFVEYFVAAFMLFSCAIVDREKLKQVLYVFLGSATIIVLLGLRQYLSPATEIFKIGATFGNRNVLGGFLSLVLPLMFGVMLFERNRARVVWLAATIAIGSVITLSGGTAVALVISLALVSMLKSQRAFLILLVVMVLGMVVILPRMPRENGRVLRESVSIYDEDGNPSKRYPEWQAAMEIVRENRLLGVSIGNYQSNVGMYYGAIPSRPEASEFDSQNMFLVIAATMGLPGMACFLGIILVFLRGAARAFFQKDADDLAKGVSLGLLGSIIAFSVNCIWSPLLVRGIGIPLALVFALTTVLERLPKDSGEQE